MDGGSPVNVPAEFGVQDLLPALTRLTRLTRLRLTCAHVSGPTALRPLRSAELGRLVELRASFVCVEGEALADLLSASLPALRKLWLCCHSSRRRPPAEVAAAATALAAAPWAAALEELTLICRLQDAGVAALAAVGFTSLRRLALMETATTGAALSALAASPAVVAGHLTHLSIGSCDPEFGRDEPAWAALAAAPLPALRELYVGIPAGSAWQGRDALARVAWLPRLGSCRLMCGGSLPSDCLRLHELPGYAALMSRGALLVSARARGSRAGLRALDPAADAADDDGDASGRESDSVYGSDDEDEDEDESSDASSVDDDDNDDDDGGDDDGYRSDYGP